ncbi:MAG TPA: hypothetical protein VE178_14740 [Silvibacterium sp.]|nr:hypothetical protein [Silvibacterium sp.]
MTHHHPWFRSGGRLLFPYPKWGYFRIGGENEAAGAAVAAVVAVE